MAVQTSGDDVSVDLHWALDHPYAPWRIDYEQVFADSAVRSEMVWSWRSPSPEHQLLLACVHAEKESRLRGRMPSLRLLSGHVSVGRWRHWIDIALILRRYQGVVDWDSVLRTAERWNISEPCLSVLLVASRLLDVELPDVIMRGNAAVRAGTDSPETCRMNSTPAIYQWLTPKLGFRGECITDAWRHLWPRQSQQTPASLRRGLVPRISHAVWASLQLSAALAEILWMAASRFILSRTRGWRPRLVADCRSRLWSVLLLALLVVTPQAIGHEFGDDLGDLPGDALELTVDGEAVFHTLEIDTDQDWFSFVVKPAQTYEVQIGMVGTEFDSASELRDRTYLSVLDRTNTLTATPVSTITWDADGPITRLYLGVTSQFQFGTGICWVAVSSVLVDVDDDGLPDSWEMAHFTNLLQTAGGDADGDGATNEAEYLLQTDPRSAQSVFRISAIEPVGLDCLVTWQATSQGWYVVEMRTNLLDGATGWAPLVTNRETGTVMRSFQTGRPGADGFYRVKYSY